MLICEILLVYTFCNAAISKDIAPTHQLRVRLSQPPIPLNSYPYQEDLTSTVKFLKEETSNKKSKVGTLIKLLKKVLTKYMDVLKENEEKAAYKTNTFEVDDSQKLKKEFVKENNTILEKKEQIVVKEFKNEFFEDVKRENIMEETYNVDNRMFDFQTPQDYNLKLNISPDERIETTVISSEDFTDNYPLDYMHNFRANPIFYLDQQEQYVLERPEPKIEEMHDFILEGNGIINQAERNAKIVMKKIPEKRLRKQKFFIPCVKASDILDDTPKYIPKDANCKDNVQPKISSDVKDIQSTLENPVANYITCSDSVDTVAMLFKPKTISLMQTYGNLLKKITVTVLVPFHVTKLVV